MINEKAVVDLMAGDISNSEFQGGNFKAVTVAANKSFFNGNINFLGRLSSSKTTINAKDKNLNFDSLDINDSTLGTVSGLEATGSLKISESKIDVSGQINILGMGSQIKDTIASGGILFDNTQGYISILDSKLYGKTTILTQGVPGNLYTGIYFSSVENNGELHVGGCSSSLSNINLLGLNKFNDLSLFSSGAKMQVFDSDFNGGSCGTGAIISLKQNLVDLKGNGEVNIRGAVGSNVRVTGKVINLFYSIANGTHIYGPITLNCDVSGVVHPTFECPDSLN